MPLLERSKTSEMSAVPPTLAQTGRRSSSSSRRAILGRGGAGNMASGETAPHKAEDLETPRIKSDMYTTGRGGSGNMAKFTDAKEARRAQDVIAHPRRESDSRTHVGRGGAANVFTPSAEDMAAARQEGEKWESAIGDDKERERKRSKSPAAGTAEKAKQWLFGKKN